MMLTCYIPLHVIDLNR